MLEREEDSEQLKVVREEQGFDFETYYNAASCVFNNDIYAFKTANYRKVFHYSLKRGKWVVFYEN